MTLRYTLLPDGASDRALVPIISWTIREHITDIRLESEVADLRRIRRPPALSDLAGRIEKAFDLNPCDVLFVHRDAERTNGLEVRRKEVFQAAEKVELTVPIIPVVPVRMTEAWLFIDEVALREAAGNPRGTMSLDLPSAQELERIHAKEELTDRLRRASALSGRRAKRFNPAIATQRLANLISDFPSLRRLNSFKAFEREISALLQTLQTDD